MVLKAEFHIIHLQCLFKRVNESLQVSSAPCLSRALYNNAFYQICSSLRIAAGISHMAPVQTKEPK